MSHTYEGQLRVLYEIMLNPQKDVRIGRIKQYGTQIQIAVDMIDHQSMIELPMHIYLYPNRTV